MIILIINQIIFKLISYLVRWYIILEERYVIHITILQLYKELIVLLIVLFFYSLWRSMHRYISFSDCVCRLEFVRRKKHSDNAPTSSDDEIQWVSPLPSCRFYTPPHDHGVHDFFKTSFIKKQFIQIIKVKMNICWIHISKFVPCPILREDFPHVVLHLSSLF